jgi:TetR/AcrR family transcriptional regulator, transcriptional repressor for nem operon
MRARPVRARRRNEIAAAPLTCCSARNILLGSIRDRPGEGCALAALGAEAARHGSPVRGAFTQGVRSLADRLTRLLPGKSKRAKRERALVIFASMVGALVLARAVDDAELSEEVLQSVLASIAHTDSPS